MIDSIKKLGLNEYESRAYNALLRKGKDSAVSVSRLANIPRARVYDVLFSLEKKGFVNRSVSKPVEFSVVKPLSAFRNVSERKKKALDTHLEEFQRIASSIEDSMDGSFDFSEDSALWCSGRENIYSKIAEELENCNEAVLISSSDAGIKRKKAVFDAKLAELASKGVRVVTRPCVNSRFVVFDKNSVLLFLSPEGGSENENALLIRSPFVASYFHSASKK